MTTNSTPLRVPAPAIGPFKAPHRVLMGPGPSEIHPRVLAAMAQPTIGHLDPAFTTMMEEMKELLRYAFQTRNAMTFPVSAPGSVGMEYCFVNMVRPGDKVIVCRNGVFGGRMIENVERCRGTAIVVEDEWGTAVDPNKLEDAFKKNPGVSVAAFVHAETSTGALSDVKSLVEISHRYGALTIVDAVTSLAGVPLLLDEWQVDAVYSGSQKCLSCTAGLSPVSFSERVVEYVKARTDKVQSWFMDMNLQLGYWGSTSRTYHHTAPINPLYGLHEALVVMKEEGLEKSWARHRRHHLALKAGLEALGLKYVVAESARLPQLNSVFVPQGVNEAEVRKQLLAKYDLEIGAGLGPLAGKIWRLGLMGYSCREETVLFCLSSLAEVLSGMGLKVGDGAAAARAEFAKSAA